MTDETLWIERLYTRFLARDLCILFSGGLFICILEYAFWREIFLPKGFSLEVIGFFMVSYFIGLFFSGLSRRLKIFDVSSPPTGYLDNLFFYQDMVKNYDDFVVNHYERFVFFLNAGSIVGLSSFLGGILMIMMAFSREILKIENITVNYILLVISLLFYGIFMMYNSLYWVQRINSARQNLAKEIAAKQKENRLMRI